jgi:hypothetical protein
MHPASMSAYTVIQDSLSLPQHAHMGAALSGTILPGHEGYQFEACAYVCTHVSGGCSQASGRQNLAVMLRRVARACLAQM